MHNEQAREAFVQDLQHALRNLYNPTALRKSRLPAWLGLEHQANPIGALRDTLTGSIHALKPDSAAPPDSSVWRTYWILTYRYLEQSGQATVAANLGLSDRQLRRQERLAEQALALYLWDRYGLEAQAAALLAPAAEDSSPLDEPSPSIPSREQELEWLHESLPTQSAAIAGVVGAALKLIAPLAQASAVQITWQQADNLPLIAGQLSIVRQALLNLLTAAVNAVPGGEVHITAAAQEHGIGVDVLALPGSSPTLRNREVADALEMARQFAPLFGGKLVVTAQDTPGAEPPGAFAGNLVLPIAPRPVEQIDVLVVDDNADTLRLMQRYLLGTRYRFVGARDPEEALALAESQPPHAIILDVMMPGIDDWELLGRLRAHPQTSSVPIAVSTILPQEQLALALGAEGFVRKPVSRQALLSVLDRLVGQS